MVSTPDDFEPGEWSDMPEIAGMTPFMCSYAKEGRRFSITLYGTDAEQVLEDNCAELENLSVDGIVICEAPAVRRRNLD